MKKIGKKIVFIAILVVIVIAAYLIFFKTEEDRTYVTFTVKKSDVINSVEASGEIYAQELVDVGAQVSGQIKKLYVNLGDFVKKGQIIAEIDAEVQEIALKQAALQLQSYQAQLKAKQTALRIATDKYSREQQLFAKKATSKDNLQEFEQSVANLTAEVQVLQDNIKKTQLDIDKSKIDLSYAKITSPLDGTVVSVVVEEGQTVNSNQTTPVIVQIADLTKMENRLEVAEGDIALIKTGKEVIYTILSNIKDKRTTVLTQVDPGPTTLSNGSYSSTSSTSSSSSAVYYYARAKIDNIDNALRIGMTTENTIVIQSAKDVLIVPETAIKKENGKNYVEVKTLLGSEKKFVEIGVSDSIYREIKSGLKEDDEIIIASVSKSELEKMSNAQVRGGRM